jgi:hypothetical protein
MQQTVPADLATHQATRRVIRRAAGRLAIIVAVAAAFAAGDPHPVARFSITVESLSYLAGALSMATAMLLRERPQPFMLTRWDESLVFGCVSLAGHIGRSFLV